MLFVVLAVSALLVGGLSLALVRQSRLLKLSEEQIYLLTEAERQRRSLLTDVLKATEPTGLNPLRRPELSISEVRNQIQLSLTPRGVVVPDGAGGERMELGLLAPIGDSKALEPVHWFHVEGGRRNEIAEGICRRNARRAVTAAGTEKRLELYCFETAHEIALLYGRNSLTDVTAKDILRAAVGFNLLLERLRLADVSVDRLLGILEFLEPLRVANDAKYYAQVGQAVYQIVGGASLGVLLRLAYLLGTPKLLLGTRGKSVLMVYFAGQLGKLLYAPDQTRDSGTGPVALEERGVASTLAA